MMNIGHYCVISTSNIRQEIGECIYGFHLQYLPQKVPQKVLSHEPILTAPRYTFDFS